MVTRVMLSAHSRVRCLPTLVEPVKSTLRMTRLAISVSLIRPLSPWTSCATPAGMPASASARNNSVQQPGVSCGGRVLTAGAFALSAFIHVALADGAGTVTESTLQGLNVLDGDTWVAFNGALGVMMLGAAGSLIPAAKGYRVLGWIALVAGVALFIPYADFIALLVTALWILVASVMLFRRAPEPRAPAEGQLPLDQSCGS